MPDQPSNQDIFAHNRHVAEAHEQAREQAHAEWEAELKATKLEPLAQTRGRLTRYQQIAAEIAAGLDGIPFTWRGVDVQHARPVLHAMGITLITQSHAEKLGFILKRGAAPVGRMYFGAPISRYANVYVLECQCNRVADAPRNAARASEES